MNSSAALRASYYGGPIGLPPRPGQQQAAVAARQSVIVQRRQTFHPVNYADYKQRCDEEKVAEIASWDTFPIDDPNAPTVSEQVWRMFTIFPYRDVSWLIVVVFAFGSLAFTVSGVFGMLAVAVDPTTLPPFVINSNPYITVIAGTMFFIAGTLALPAAWNADKGTLEPIEVKVEDGPTKTYKPALLGSPAWVWIPSRDDLRSVTKTVPFRTGLIQMAGGTILTASGYIGLPGVLDPTNPSLVVFGVFIPLTIGASFLFLANFILTIWLQPKWYRPDAGSATWQGAFWSTFGSLLFVFTGAFLIINDAFNSAIVNLIGSVAFLWGSIIQWYDLMGFHPDNWAS